MDADTGSAPSAACDRNDDVRECRIGALQVPDNGRRAVAKGRAAAAREHRRRVPAFDAQHPVADGVDAEVHRVQVARRDPPRDRGGAQAEARGAGGARQRRAAAWRGPTASARRILLAYRAPFVEHRSRSAASQVERHSGPSERNDSAQRERQNTRTGTPTPSPQRVRRRKRPSTHAARNATQSDALASRTMSAAETVLKPDLGARRKHFIFTDEHEQLRESIRRFAIKELAPHAEEWEETTFPDWVFPRMGELGFLGLDKPEEYGGQGGDYYSSARARRGDRARATPAAWRWASRCTPTWRCRRSSPFGTEEQKQRVGRAGDQGREDPLPRASPSPTPAPTSPGIKTRAVRDGDEYVINGSKTYITNGHRADVIVLVTKTDPDAGYDGFTLFLVADGRARRDPREEAREARHARLRHGAARLPGRARARRRRCSARSARASTTSCGSSRASG